jgi:hypothetical protein
MSAAVFAADVPLELSADTVRVSEDEVRAAGDVSLIWDGNQVHADLLEVQLLEGGGVDFQGENASWSRCICDTPLWSVSADAVEGSVGKELVLNQARLRVCDVPVLPVPWLRVPLDERAPRIMFPEGGFTSGSPWMALPVFVPVGDASDLVLAPEVWKERGVRQRVEWQSPFGTGLAVIGKEDTLEPFRGMGAMDGAYDDGLYRVGIDGLWLSDSAYLADFGEDYWTRNTPWAEQRTMVGFGPFRLQSATTDTDSLQRPISGVLALTGKQVGPVGFSGVVRTDLMQDPANPSGDQLQRGVASFMATTGRDFGFVEADSVMQVQAIQWSDSNPRTGTEWTSRVHLPMWGDVGSVRHLASLGFEFGFANTVGTVDVRDPRVRDVPGWSAGPLFRSEWLTSTGVPLHGEAKVMMTEDGVRPSGAINFQTGPWTVVGQGEEDLQGGRVGFDDEWLSVGVASARVDGLFQAGFSGAFSVGAGWRPGWSGVMDVPTGSMIQQGPHVVYSSPCDCFDVRMQAEWSPERILPDALVRIDLR